jgi:hypothetical protein
MAREGEGTDMSENHGLTIERLADLQAFARGEQPELQPLRRRWLVSHGYLVPSTPPRAPRNALGRRRMAPRKHELTQKGRDAVTIARHIEESPFGGARPRQPGTGYQSSAVKRSVRR